MYASAIWANETLSFQKTERPSCPVAQFNGTKEKGSILGCSICLLHLQLPLVTRLVFSLILRDQELPDLGTCASLVLRLRVKSFWRKFQVTLFLRGKKVNLIRHYWMFLQTYRFAPTESSLIEESAHNSILLLLHVQWTNLTCSPLGKTTT